MWSSTVPSWGNNQNQIPQPNGAGDKSGAITCAYRQYEATLRNLEDMRITLNFKDSGKDTCIMGSSLSTPFVSYYETLTNTTYNGGRIGMLVDGTEVHPILDPAGSI